jgi:type VI secretion system protein ImpL
VRTRRVPQWIFLGHLFSNVILQDRTAQGASGASAGAQMTRRLAVSVLSAIFFLWMIALTVSYFGNRSLETQVIDAARGIAATESGGAVQELPSLNALQRLDTLRQSVELLSRYEREGAPWRLRWGLYVGHTLRPEVRALYFANFRRLLLLQTPRQKLFRVLPASQHKVDHASLVNLKSPKQKIQ